MKKLISLFFFALLCSALCSQQSMKTLSEMHFPENGDVAVINIKGDTLIPFYFNQLMPISEDRFLAFRGDDAFIVDTLQNIWATQENRLIQPFAPFYANEDIVHLPREIKDSLLKVYDGTKFYPQNRLLVRDWEPGNGKMGVIDFHGNEVIPDKHLYIETIWTNKSYLVTTVVDNEYRMGVMDSLGNEVVPFIYDRIFKLGNPHYLAVKDRMMNCGVIDLEGNIVVPLQYSYLSAVAFDKKLFRVAHFDGYNSIIDVDGNEIIPPQSNTLIPIGKKHIIVKNEDRKLGIIDWQNNMIVPFIYDRFTFPFHHYDYSPYLIVTNDKKNGVLNMETGKVVIPLIYDEIEGLYDKDIMLFTATKGNVCSVVDINNKVLFTTSKDAYIEYLNDNLYLISTESDVKDEDGTLHNKTIRIVDSKGKDTTPYVYDEVNDLFKNIIVAQKGKYGMLDENGKIIIPLIYSGLDNIDSYRDEDGREDYYIAQQNSLSMLIDINQKMILPDRYQEIYSNSNYGGNYRLKKDGKWGLYNAVKDSLVIPYEYSWIGTLSQNREYFVVEKGKLQGIVDKEGNVLLPCIYMGLQQSAQKRKDLPNQNPDLFVIER